MSKEYKALDLAKYIVQKCIDDDCPISHLQLQKILYFIQEAFLRNGHPAFPDPIEAWQFGPVVPDVYNHYCVKGAMPILGIPEEFQTDDDKIPEIDEDVRQIVDRVAEEKRKLSPWDMVQATHEDGGPWDETYENGKGNRCEIPIERIKESFKSGFETGFR